MRCSIKFLSDILFSDLGCRLHTHAADLNALFSCYGVWPYLTGDSLSEEYLYIVKASLLPEALPEIHGAVTLLCSEDAPVPSAFLDDPRISLLLFPAAVSRDLILRRVCRMFTQDGRSVSSLWVTLDSISKSEGFPKLTSHIRDSLSCSCAVLSRGFKMLGYAIAEGHAISSVWESMLDSRIYPFGSLLSSATDSPVVLDTGKPAVYPFSDQIPDAGDALFPIVMDTSPHTPMGYLLITYTRSQQLLGHIEAIDFICHALSWRMWRYIQFKSNIDSSVGFLLCDLISGNKMPQSEVDRKLAQIKYVPRPFNYMIIVYTSASESSHSWEHIKLVFSSTFPEALTLSISSDLVLFLSCKAKGIDQQQLERLSQLLEEYGCYAGISECITTINDDLHNHFCRTLAAAKAAKYFLFPSRYAWYKNIALQHFVTCGAEVPNQRSLVSPNLKELIIYDQLHQSELLYTLRCYLHYSKNIQQTCTCLHIHKNTLFYRLNKIKELLGQDFNDTNTLIALSLSISILEKFGDIPYIHFPQELTDI